MILELTLLYLALAFLIYIVNSYRKAKKRKEKKKRINKMIRDLAGYQNESNR